MTSPIHAVPTARVDCTFLFAQTCAYHWHVIILFLKFYILFLLLPHRALVAHLCYIDFIVIFMSHVDDHTNAADPYYSFDPFSPQSIKY